MTAHQLIEDIAIRESGGDLLFLLPPTSYNKDTPIHWSFDEKTSTLELFKAEKKIAATFVDDDKAKSLFASAKEVVIIETDADGGIGSVNQYADVRKKSA